MDIKDDIERTTVDRFLFEILQGNLFYQNSVFFPLFLRLDIVTGSLNYNRLCSFSLNSSFLLSSSFSISFKCLFKLIKTKCVCVCVFVFV